MRELRNAIERMIIACDEDVIGPAHLPPAAEGANRVATAPGSEPFPAEGTLQELREEAERRIVKAALDRHGGHLTNTARALGLADHASLSKVIKRLGIERGEPGRRG